MSMQMLMTMELPSLDEQIAEIEESFDFSLVHSVMSAMGWKWPGVDETTGEDGFLPSVEDMRILAGRMLREVAGVEGDSTARRCGFVVSKRNGYLNLYYVGPEESSHA